MNRLDAIAGNKFPVFNFGSDLMNLKFLIVLTMVLCAFCVLPVNAETVTCYVDGGMEQQVNIGYANSVTIFLSGDHFFYSVSVDNELYIARQEYDYTDITLPEDKQSIYVVLEGRKDLQNNFRCGITIFYTYSDNGQPPIINDYDIDIDLQEQTIELGVINNLEQTFDIGSSSGRIITDYFTYSATSCTIDDLQRNYVKVKFNENFLDDSEIYLSGYALKDTTESEFNTYVRFNFTYIPVTNLQAFIQTFDYQSGNLVSGVNLSVYEIVTDNNTMLLGTRIFNSNSADSQTILMVKNDTDYFVKNELSGYLSVKNENYPYLNNEYGYWWNPTISNPLMLYYSRLDPTAQYNANFIVQDVNNNGISGVSVTMDNAVTKVSNSIGGLSFNNVSAGTHTFVFVKNGYQTAEQTIDIQLQYAVIYQTMYKDNQIIQPTVQPTAYPTIQPTLQPTISPIDKPSNLAESVKYGLAKMFGVNSLNTINLIFALLIILFPAVVAGVITNQALGFIAGGLIGFVFALGIGLIPIWVFFSMIMLSVIYLVMTHTESGF